MKSKTSRAFKCFKCFVVFYLIFNCILGISTALFASYLLIFRYGNSISRTKDIVLCFAIIPALLTVLSTIVGWTSFSRRNINLLKFVSVAAYGNFEIIQSLLTVLSTIVGWTSFSRRNISLLKFSAVLLAVTDILQIVGCLWCFTRLPHVNENILEFMEDKFSTRVTDPSSEHWWNGIQIKLKCCGMYGPSDYSSTKAVPFSCCGSDSEDRNKGFCSFLWQKGCSSTLAKELSLDLILLGVIGLCTAFLQVPGVFIIWCFAQRIAKENI